MRAHREGGLPLQRAGPCVHSRYLAWIVGRKRSIRWAKTGTAVGHRGRTGVTGGRRAATDGGRARRSPTARILLGALFSCAALFGAVSPAWAGTLCSAAPNVPPNVAAGPI